MNLRAGLIVVLALVCGLSALLGFGSPLPEGPPVAPSDLVQSVAAAAVVVALGMNVTFAWLWFNGSR